MSGAHQTAGASARLERVVGVVLRGGVIASSTCLTIGLLLSVVTEGSAIAAQLLNAGIVVLLATPVARVVVSTIEYVVEEDWRFATLTCIVLLELIASAVAALVFKRRI
jgi:uncharacterized membrane protein